MQFTITQFFLLILFTLLNIRVNLFQASILECFFALLGIIHKSGQELL